MLTRLKMCWFQIVMAIIIISGSLHSLTFEIMLNKINVSLVTYFTYMHIQGECARKQVIIKVKNIDFCKHVIIQVAQNNALTFSISK